jgi:hypothetical protein
VSACREVVFADEKPFFNPKDEPPASFSFPHKSPAACFPAIFLLQRWVKKAEFSGFVVKNIFSSVLALRPAAFFFEKPDYESLSRYTQPIGIVLFVQ